MHRKLLPALLGLVLTISAAPPSSAAESGVWLDSLDKALEQAARNDSYILIDLFAEWCGWCRVLEEQVFTTPEFGEFTRDFVLLRVDVDDGAEGSAVQARFEAYSLPTTLIIDKNQVKVGAVVGFAPAPDFLQNLSAEIASYGAFLEFYKEMRTSDDLAVLYGLSQELHARGDGERSVVVLREILQHTGEDSPKVAWLRYLMADAYRLWGRYDDALDVLNTARSLSGNVNQRELVERIDLLSYRIAHDAHNCDRAKKSLEHFLASHPGSSFRREAEKTLRDLREGQGLDCA